MDRNRRCDDREGAILNASRANARNRSTNNEHSGRLGNTTNQIAKLKDKEQAQEDPLSFVRLGAIGTPQQRITYPSVKVHV
jgi:hypothetical protein